GGGLCGAAQGGAGHGRAGTLAGRPGAAARAASATWGPLLEDRGVRSHRRLAGGVARRPDSPPAVHRQAHRPDAGERTARTPAWTAKEQPLAKIFSDEYMFSIPAYQRPYSWGVDQAQELLDDLLGYMRTGGSKLEDIPPYFLGSLVLIKEESSPRAQVVD